MRTKLPSASDLREPTITLVVILAGLLAPLVISTPRARALIWMSGLVGLGLPLVAKTVKGMLAGRFAADIVAALAVVTAVVLGQPLAGLVIVMMQTGGEALETYAARRASNAVAELEAQSPRIAHRQVDGATEDLAVELVEVGDRVLVRPGEMVPCDGVVRDGISQLDTSRLTGEPLPRRVEPAAVVSSGCVNLDSPLLIEVTTPASGSLYARIVELVRSAQAGKAPLQRLADRAAMWFTPLTILVCVAAYLGSHDPLRVLAVLVVATPCPLILAAPVAILGGINRAARHQIIVRHGGALEQLAAVDIAVFDKTGTVTEGRPAVASVQAFGGFTEVELFRLAGAVELGSGHLLARTFADAATARVGRLPVATTVVESAGRGVTGIAEGRRVTIGALTLLREWEPGAAAELEATQDGAGLRGYIAIDGRAAGIVTYADRIRPEAKGVLRALTRLGVRQQILLSGDRTVNVLAAAREIGFVDAAGDLLPQDKVAYVARLGKQGHRVLMVGDGANDAPALSAAAVGLALAAHGGGISAEAADVVLLVDDLTRVPEAVAIARRTMRIARESIGVGLGLSAIAMVAAGLGWVAPVAGALLQEGIDVAVILNALRTIRPGPLEQAIHAMFEGR